MIGLPPHTRGSLPGRRRTRQCGGSTPHTRGSLVRAIQYDAHPRSTPAPRGEAGASPAGRQPETGLPPHTRGSQGGRRRWARSVAVYPRNTRGSRCPPSIPAARAWSTPAHAGKPYSASSVLWTRMVYPRTRGEAASGLMATSVCGGLPPHTRGSLSAMFNSTPISRSTPAHAGKPSSTARRPPLHTVYPRTRGEAESERGTDVDRWGLPPHTRGSLL